MILDYLKVLAVRCYAGFMIITGIATVLGVIAYQVEKHYNRKYNKKDHERIIG